MNEMIDQTQIPNYRTHHDIEKLPTGEDCFIAWHPELDSVVGMGATLDQALEDLREALLLALDDMAESRVPFPEPLVWPGMVESTWVFSRGVEAEATRPPLGGSDANRQSTTTVELIAA